MRNFTISILANWISLIILSTILKDWIFIESPLIAFLTALILTLVNYIIKPIIMVLAIPLNIITLGLFTLIINAFILYLVSIYTGVSIANFFPAAFCIAIIIGIALLAYVIVIIMGTLSTAAIVGSDTLAANQTSYILGNVSQGVTGFFSSIAPIYAILAVLVIILVLVVLVRVVQGKKESESEIL